MSAAERVEWLSPFGTGDVTLLEARQCARTWRLYHDAYAFCAVHEIHGARPRLRYRRWDEQGVSKQVQLYEPGEVHECTTRGAGDCRGEGFVDRVVPTGTFTQLSAHENYACAVATDGSPSCW